MTAVLPLRFGLAIARTGPFIDDNAVTSWIDDNAVTSWIDDNGIVG